MHHLAPRRSRMRLALAAAALAVGFTMVGAGPALAASDPTLTITTTGGAEVGDSVDVAVAVVDAYDVYGYAITLSYDPAIFAYTVDSASAGPAGGFDSVVPGDGTVTLVHTRLGTSPVLAPGTLPATLSFTTIGSGTGAITASVSLVGASGAAGVAVLPVASDPIVVAAIPVPEPTATATPTATPTPSGSATPSPSATTAATGSLASTGVDGGILLAVALAGGLAIALGVIAYRRRAASAR